jgi:hypothetical protein
MNDAAERIRIALVEAALRAYDDAGMRGLCSEGRWEAAVSTLRSLDLGPALREGPGEPGTAAGDAT